MIRELKKLPSSLFHIAIELPIDNDPANAARHFDRFFDLESARFQIGAAYTKMNGFDINPDRWYCDLFAYATDGGLEEQDWLSDWQSNRFEEYPISGLEPLQRVYASNAFGKTVNQSASDMSSLLVVIKFQAFMQRTVAHMKTLQFPLYVTAHDYDFIASFDLRPASARMPIAKASAEEAINDLITRLNHGDSRVRIRAMMKLYSVGPAAKGAIPSLLMLLDDADPLTRQSAASALGKIDPMSDLVVSALVARLAHDQQPLVRHEIARTLGNSPTRKATRALANALESADRNLRYQALISLKLLGRHAKEAAPALQQLMETETDDLFQAQATAALKGMREK